MDTTKLTAVEELISQFGFPIIMCGVLCWYIYRLQKQHKDEIDQLRGALDNNTKVMQELIALVKGGATTNG